MIVDKLENIGCYRGISENLDKAIDFLIKNDVNDLDVGRHEIDGDKVYALAQSNTTLDPSQVKYEAHRKYIDIQCFGQGNETIYCAQVSEMEIDTEYSEKDDAMFLKDTENIPAIMKPGTFAILFPQDAHKPCCIHKQPNHVKKVVVKVAV
jgi:biofilm protein TabA